MRAREAPSVGDSVEVRVEKLVYGGLGLAHVDGRSLLVPFAAPGDRLRVRITESGRRVLGGAIEAVLAPSVHRREPACRHFGVCGGCQLQHLDRGAQLAAKADFVRDCLRRIGGVRWDREIEVDSAAEYGWRSRAELHIERADGASPRIGYFRAGSRDLVEIEDCPILVPALRAEVALLSADSSGLPREGDRLALAAGDDGTVVQAGATGREASVRQRIAGLDYRFGADSFSQVNRPLVEGLVRRAVGHAMGATAIDLYAGAGLFALQLAGRFALVHAVESDRPAVRLGRENARANGIANVQWSERSVEEWLLSGDPPSRPDFALLDPPRAGAGAAVVAGIAALQPRTLTYVSCDPATLARDLRLFRGRGFEIESIVALDMFPQSYHVEVVARLRPRGSFDSTTTP